MATPARYCPSCLSRASNTTTRLLRPSRHTLAIESPFNQLSIRTAVASANAAKYKRKDAANNAPANKRKQRSTFQTPDLRQAIQFSLVDAMRCVSIKPYGRPRSVIDECDRYLRAAEVGRPPTSSKYEIHLRFKTLKNGPVVRNRMRLPHPVNTDLRICVIAPPDSAPAKAAKQAGASLVGEDEIFEAVKAGNIDFDRCICHVDSLPKLSKSGIARMLGPRGLMPSAKTGTVVKDVKASVGEMVGASEYRERLGVVRICIGQLAFTPEELQANIRAFVERIKRDIAGLSDRISKDIHEVVLSSTNGPGLSLNGEFRSTGAGREETSTA
ncbi:50S ribosomal protein L1 [Teratosphaeria destructans]|uniref:50S ribosomal protein L1 n=1 Tax=Teratosphaeria destructans TaxID=418781 RepID=A0A9W7W767_9PEZI|nr:50S ribosomal protein L1 [Teratosphaeria destructans]